MGELLIYLGQIIGAMAVAIMPAAWLWKVVGPRVQAFLARLEKVCGLVEKELAANGGGSIRDSVMLMRVDLAFVRAWSDATAAALHIGKWEADAEGRTTQVSLALCRLCGRTASEFVGLGWINVVSEEDQECVRESWAAAVADHRAWNMDFRFTFPDGEKVMVRAIAHPVFDGDRVVGWTGSAMGLEAAAQAA